MLFPLDVQMVQTLPEALEVQQAEKLIRLKVRSSIVRYILEQVFDPEQHGDTRF
jgi:hypothetical protein